jgi:hypothetical protein
MLATLKKLLGTSVAKSSCPVSDPILGELRLSEGGNWWEGSTTVSGESVGFKIGGGVAPDAALLTHAHEIVGTFPGFQRMIREFLAEEARRVKHLKQLAHEIEQLGIEDVCLFWPKRPNDGMIYFKGPDRYRVWRCDYVGRKPKGLGFDD